MPLFDPAPSEAFGRAFPAIAERLAAPGDDPEVERLVEGFAELAARVERVLDATAGRATAHFADLLAPEILRPFPSATILELTPKPTLGRVEVDAGAEFDSISLDGVRCRFTAHAPFAVVPWRVADARAIASVDRGHAIEVTLTATGARRRLETLLPLRLHASGSTRPAALLLAWLHEHATGIRLLVDDRDVPVARARVRGWGTRRDEALLPPEPLEHPGVRLLREWMVLPAKLAFLEITGVPGAAEPASRVVLRIALDSPLPPSVALNADALRTNCVPVANAFAATADPVRVSLEHPTPAVRVAGITPEYAEVYAVRDVTALFEDGRAARVPPVAAFEAAAANDAAYRYALERSPSRLGDGTDVALLAALPSGAPRGPALQVLSVDLWATNRSLPASLGVGDVRIPAPGTPAGVTFRNLRAVTPHRSAPHGDPFARRALALVALSARSLAHRDSLRALVHALDLHALADAQASRALALRLEAIGEVTARRRSERVGGVQARGHDVALHLAEGGFDGEGEAFLFAQVIATLLGYEASLNAFVRTTARLVTTGRTFAFPPKSGDEELG